MGFNLDDLTRKAKDVAYVAADKARDAADLARINLAIAGEQKDMDKYYRMIGEWFVEEYEGEIPDKVRELVQSIAGAKARIAELESNKPGRGGEEQNVPPTDTQRACPICGAVSDSRFCPQCGAPMAD